MMAANAGGVTVGKPDDWDEVESEDEEELGAAPRAAARHRARPAVLFADESIVVVNKPPGLAAAPHHHVEHSVLDEINDAVGLEPVYRIDDDASGVIAYSASPQSRAALREARHAGRIVLTYEAIVRATLPNESGSIDRAIAPVGSQSLNMRIDERHGRPAQTQWRLRDAYAGFALLECTACTHVEHQVRVHLASVGMPIAVDPVYGGGRELFLSSFKVGYRPSRRRPERPLIGRLSLHLAAAELPHPSRGEVLRFSAPPPRDFKATVYQLDKYGRLVGPADDRRK